MLILGRRTGESIEIGSSISVRIVAVKGGTVKVAIDAPPDVTILRGEVPCRRNDFPQRANLPK